MAIQKEVNTAAGFLDIVIELDKKVPIDLLGLVRTTVYISDVQGEFEDSIPVSIGKREIIVVPPGKLRVVARLGGLQSEEIEVEVQSGEIVKLVFGFGKKSL